SLDEMLLENPLRPFTAWAHERRSLSRNQSHGSPGNLLDLYAASDIPETELFGPLGDSGSDPLISKFASSAAHVAGRRLTSAETATWLGEHFTHTLDQLKREVDQLSVFEVQPPGWFHATPVGAVARVMWQRGYGFDYVSDLLLQPDASTLDYRAVVAPSASHMPEETFARLLDLARAGATVIFVD